MANPFDKRATEYLRDDEAGFLSVVSPEPLLTYLKRYADRGLTVTRCCPLREKYLDQTQAQHSKPEKQHDRDDGRDQQ